MLQIGTGSEKEESLHRRTNEQTNGDGNIRVITFVRAVVGSSTSELSSTLCPWDPGIRVYTRRATRLYTRGFNLESSVDERFAGEFT